MQGFSQSYTTGSFTADAVAQTLGPGALGLTMALNNVMEVIAALAFGRLSDLFGRFPCFVVALLLEMVNPLYFSLFPVVPGSGQRKTMMFLAMCLGAGSSGCVCCLRALIGDMFDGDETGIAMSTTFLVLSFSAGSGYCVLNEGFCIGNDGFCMKIDERSGFYLGPNISLPTKARVYLGLLALSLISSFHCIASCCWLWVWSFSAVEGAVSYRFLTDFRLSFDDFAVVKGSKSTTTIKREQEEAQAGAIL